LFAGAQKAIAWFLDGLTEATADLMDRITKRTPIRLVSVGKGAYAIEQPDGKRERTQLKLAHVGDKAQLLPPEAAKQLSDRDVDLVMEPDELLVRTLDPLPAESRQYIDGIVRHQLDRFVPWRSDNVLYSYEITQAGPDHDRLLVHIAATARTLHAPLIEAANASVPRKLRLVYPAAGQTGNDIAITIDNGKNETAYARQLRTGIVGGLAALILLTIGAFGYLIYDWQNATDALGDAEQTEAALRKQMGGRGPQETAANRDLRSILDRKKARPPTVLALDELSSALPDDTWLSELQIAEGQMRVSGTSQSVADLVPAVQEKPIFADATFFSPTTRLTQGEGDRFHLQMRLVPPKAAK